MRSSCSCLSFCIFFCLGSRFVHTLRVSDDHAYAALSNILKMSAGSSTAPSHDATIVHCKK
ncbi:hypothetical protein KC19_5G157500 [Ceratodon purpureus]|uniref:Secreted protein n=1 Tax=Ceratodon purpureus TaxID=3225 RepID=A0A8T0I2V7_CERPU|nr:hypothetical protein KC19_5G157500 [Ceratodon purpureus]